MCDGLAGERDVTLRAVDVVAAVPLWAVGVIAGPPIVLDTIVGTLVAVEERLTLNMSTALRIGVPRLRVALGLALRCLAPSIRSELYHSALGAFLSTLLLRASLLRALALRASFIAIIVIANTVRLSHSARDLISLILEELLELLVTRFSEDVIPRLGLMVQTQIVVHVRAKVDLTLLGVVEIHAMMNSGIKHILIEPRHDPHKRPCREPWDDFSRRIALRVFLLG